MKTTTGRVTALLGALLVAGAVSTAGAGAAGATKQAPRRCTAGDVVVQLGPQSYVDDDRYAPLQIFAKAGVRCTMRGVPTQWELRDYYGNALPFPFAASGTGRSVTIADRVPAHVVLKRSGVSDGQYYDSPYTLTVTLPGISTPVTVDWAAGDIVNLQPIEVGPVLPGADVEI